MHALCVCAFEGNNYMLCNQSIKQNKSNHTTLTGRSKGGKKYRVLKSLDCESSRKNTKITRKIN